jgi:hypothetical protein
MQKDQLALTKKIDYYCKENLEKFYFFFKIFPGIPAETVFNKCKIIDEYNDTSDYCGQSMGVEHVRNVKGYIDFYKKINESDFKFFLNIGGGRGSPIDYILLKNISLKNNGGSLVVSDIAVDENYKEYSERILSNFDKVFIYKCFKYLCFDIFEGESFPKYLFDCISIYNVLHFYNKFGECQDLFPVFSNNLNKNGIICIYNNGLFNLFEDGEYSMKRYFETKISDIEKNKKDDLFKEEFIKSPPSIKSFSKRAFTIESIITKNNIEFLKKEFYEILFIVYSSTALDFEKKIKLDENIKLEDLYLNPIQLIVNSFNNFEELKYWFCYDNNCYNNKDFPFSEGRVFGFYIEFLKK